MGNDTDNDSFLVFYRRLLPAAYRFTIPVLGQMSHFTFVFDTSIITL